MESRAKDFSYTTDQDSSLSHKRKIDAGGYGDVHEVVTYCHKLTIVDVQSHFRTVYREKVAASFKFENGPTVIQNEARAVKKLCDGTHPNLILVFRMGELRHSPYYFIDMELCDLSLQAYLYPYSLLSTTGLGLPPFLKDLPSSLVAVHIWNIMKQIANGLKFIHDHSEVHRDLKPSNVLYSRKASLWKLTDFGLTSEATANQINSTTSARGSPGYRAPELGLHNKYGNKVDIWSMGCLFHELATGKQAFISDIAVVTHYLQNVPFLVSLGDNFDDTTRECISDAIVRMLQKEPSERPSAATLYDEFSSHCVFGTPAVLADDQHTDSEDTQKSTTITENLSPITEEDASASLSMAQHSCEWPDYGIIEEQMKEAAISPNIEPEQMSKSLALTKSPHTPPDSPSVVFPGIPEHAISTYNSYALPDILRSVPPDLWSPVSSAHSPHSPSTKSPFAASDFLRAASSTNLPLTRPTHVRFVPGDLPSPVSSTNSPLTPSSLPRPLSSTNYSILKSAPPDFSNTLSSTNSPQKASDLRKPVSPVESPYPPSAPPKPGFNDLPSLTSFNGGYPQTSPDLPVSVTYNNSPYTPPARIPAVQRQGPPRLVMDLNYPVANQVQEGYTDQGEPYRLNLPRAVTEFANFPSQDFSPTDLAAAHSVARDDSPPFSPLRQIKKLFKRRDSFRQTSPTFTPWRDDDPSERRPSPSDLEMPGSPRPFPDDHITPSGRTQGFE